MRAGRDLDALVAEKVMGTDVGDIFYDATHQEIMPSVPSYSTDMAAAWQVVEHLLAKGRPLALQAPGSYDMNEEYHQFTRWMAGFSGGVGFTEEVEADTAPLAICLAALKAVGVKLDD